jgi:hypothetical protein
MIDRVIKFRNLDGEWVEEHYWFRLSTTDAIDMELMQRPDVQDYLQTILQGKNGVKMLSLMQEMIFQSVAKRDGQRLRKEGVKQEFIETGAWDALFDELMQAGDGEMTSFFLKILPEDVQTEMAKESAKQYTDEELLAMSDKQFFKAAGVSTLDQMDARFLQIAVRRKQGKPGKKNVA